MWKAQSETLMTTIVGRIIGKREAIVGDTQETVLSCAILPEQPVGVPVQTAVPGKVGISIEDFRF